MSEQKPTVVLVHGAFAESASWNPVIEKLQARGVEAVAIGNPLRSVASDAAYVRDAIAGMGGPVVLVGHSYGGMVITEAAAKNDSVVALVYVGAFAPDHGESAFALSTQFPGSTLGDALGAYPLSTGGNELFIRRDVYPQQFAADVPLAQAALMAATQRSVTEAALTEALPTDTPAWKDTPSWFVIGELDLNIPAELQRFHAERAGSKGTREVAGASHALSVSGAEPVTEAIVEAIARGLVGRRFGVRMNPAPLEANPNLRIIEELIDEHVRVDCTLIQIDAETWAIHGSIAVDGEVILAEFDNADDAEAALERIAAAEASAVNPSE